MNLKLELACWEQSAPRFRFGLTSVAPVALPIEAAKTKADGHGASRSDAGISASQRVGPQCTHQPNAAPSRKQIQAACQTHATRTRIPSFGSVMGRQAGGARWRRNPVLGCHHAKALHRER